MEVLMKDMRGKYRTTRGMIDKPDKEKSQYASKVQAQENLIRMRNTLAKILNKSAAEPSLSKKILGMFVVIVYDLGLLALDLGDLKDALASFHEVLVMIPDKMSRPTPNFVLVSIKARNALVAEYIAIKPKVAARMVDEADRIYHSYRKIFPKKDPYSHEDHFAEKAKFMGGNQLVQAHSLTKFYLRQFSRPVSFFYKTLGDCYKTLEIMATTKITELSERAEIAIILGEYFINEREFHYGRYLLSIAAYIIDKYEAYTKELEAKREAMKQQSKTEGTETSEEVNEGKEDNLTSAVVEENKKKVKPSLGENEVLVEIGGGKKGPIFPVENEIFVEVEERKEESDASEDGDDMDDYIEVGEGTPSSDSSEEMDMSKTRGTWIEFEEPTEEEEIKGWRAFLARAWVKYGLHLMKHASQAIEEPKFEVRRHIPEFPKFKDLDVSIYENMITDEYPKTAEEAASVFLFTQYKIVHAKSYYTLFLYPHEHVALAQEHSLLIRYMMKYENDEKALRKCLKARIRMLEPLSLQLNYKNYLPACRLLWFELGKCYHELLLLKYDKMSAKGGDEMRKAVERVNHYCSTGIVHLHNYIDSFRDRNFRLPHPVPPEAVVKFVFAHFYLGRLYHSYITFDQDEANEFIMIAFSCFRYVVKHCERDEALMEALKYQYEMLKVLRIGCYKNKLLLVRQHPE